MRRLSEQFIKNQDHALQESDHTEQQGSEKDIGSGITEISEGSFKTYELKKIINGLEYSIRLDKQRGLLNRSTNLPLISGHWELSFHTEGIDAVTNKGMKVFQQVVDEIVTLINKVQSLETVKTISFTGSEVKLRLEEIKKLQKTLQKKYLESPDSFNGFRYEINDERDNFWGMLEIKDGTVFRKPYAKTLFGSTDKYQTPLETFLNDDNEIMKLFTDKSDVQKLLDHLSIQDKTILKRDNTAADSRTNLYERTLKRRFPKYKFKRQGNTIKIYLNPSQTQSYSNPQF